MTPFIAQIMITGFNFAPKGWASCQGQFLPINQNQALFSLLGTTFGGNGQTNFALPNLQARLPVGSGGGYTMGQNAGLTQVTLNMSQLPAHNHQWNGTSTAPNTRDPTGYLAGGGLYANTPVDTAMNTAMITNVGGSQPHTNEMPYLILNYCIALQGIFPSQN